MKVDPKKHGDTTSQKPTLSVDDFDGADIAVMTIAEYREANVNGRVTGVLEFEEFPEHIFWLNKSGTRAIVERLGDESDAWVGHSIPLMRVRTQNPQSGEMVTRYHVAPATEWDDMFADAAPKEQVARKRVTRKPVKRAKRTRK